MAVRARRVRGLPVGLASNGEADEYTPPEVIQAELTTLQRDERCDGCPWPDVCAGDRTCWRAERSQPWQRTRIVTATRADSRWTRERALDAIRAYHDRHGRPPTYRQIQGRCTEHGLPSWSVIADMFGSIADAVEQAGFDRPKPGKRRKPMLG